MERNESAKSRVTSPALDEVLGKRFPVLDDGFIRVIDYMGADEAIVQAARVSYGRGTKRVHEDRGLIRYLLRHSHTTPFEMCEIKLHVRVPMDCWRQWIRHRTANVNEYSTRYSVAINAAQRTGLGSWRLQAPGNRQGSVGAIDPDVGKVLSERERETQELSRKVYEERLAQGVAREQARKDLPLSTYTEAYWKIDLHNLFHFLKLRLDDHAQFEIRAYAQVIGCEIVARWCPVAWSAFQDYSLNQVRLTSQEAELLRAVVAGRLGDATRIAVSFGWLDKEGLASKRNRERVEAELKLSGLGIRLPWMKRD